MGRINIVNLYGWIVTDIDYKNDPITHELSIAKFPIRVSRRQYANEYGQKGGASLLSTPIVISRNPEILKTLFLLSKGDMVLVKGNLCTKERNRIFVCPDKYCDYEEILEQSVTIYIDPVFVCKVGHMENPKGNDQYVDNYIKNELSEISNQVLIEGRLCRDVDYYEDPNGKFRKCEYQIAVNRLRRIRQDEKDRNTDYPWVISFGKMAMENSASLHTNSVVTINGAIHTKSFKEPHICKLCGATIWEPRTVTKIVPYSVEYRENCNKPESSHKKTEDSDEEDKLSLS